MCSPEALLLAAVSTVRWYWCWAPGTFSCSAVTRVEVEEVEVEVVAWFRSSWLELSVFSSCFCLCGGWPARTLLLLLLLKT